MKCFSIIIFSLLLTNCFSQQYSQNWKDLAYTGDSPESSLVGGSIQKVIFTLRGVEIRNASSKIQIDRYSHISSDGVSIEFLDDVNAFEGWKIIMDDNDSSVQYNSVDFGDGKFKAVNVRALSKRGNILQIKLDGIDGPGVSELEIDKNEE